MKVVIEKGRGDRRLDIRVTPHVRTSNLERQNRLVIEHVGKIRYLYVYEVFSGRIIVTLDRRADWVKIEPKLKTALRRVFAETIEYWHTPVMN